MKIQIDIPETISTPLLKKVPEKTLKSLVYSYVLGLTLGAVSSGSIDSWENLVKEIAGEAVIAVEILD